METWKPIFSQLCIMTMWLIMLMKNVKLPYTLSTPGLPGQSASCRAAVRTTDHMITKNIWSRWGIYLLAFISVDCPLLEGFLHFKQKEKDQRHYSGHISPILVTTDCQECLFQIFPTIPCILDTEYLVLWALWTRWINISYEQKSASHH